MLRLTEWVDLHEMSYSQKAENLEHKIRGPDALGERIGNTGIDAHLHHAGGVHGLEIGMKGKDFHQIYCKYDEHSGWSANHTNPVINRYINHEMQVEGSNRKGLPSLLHGHFGDGPSANRSWTTTKRTEFNHKSKQMDKRSYTPAALAVQDGPGYSVSNIPDKVIRQSYAHVGKHYVFMEGKGLFRTGKDHANLGVPLFATHRESTGFVLNMRPKPGKRNSEGFRHHNAVAHVKVEHFNAIKEHAPTKTTDGLISFLTKKGVKVGSMVGGTPRSHINDHEREYGVELQKDHLKINDHA